MVKRKSEQFIKNIPKSVEITTKIKLIKKNYKLINQKIPLITIETYINNKIQKIQKIPPKTIENYMVKKDILQIEIDVKQNTALVLEPICNAEKTFWIESWFSDEISTDTLREHMKQEYQWVQYFLKDFLNEVLDYD